MYDFIMIMFFIYMDKGRNGELYTQAKMDILQLISRERNFCIHRVLLISHRRISAWGDF
jgi:hypothetical protein